MATALISTLSILVISLVIWLVLVFLSVTSGMERNWLHKLTSLHAPIRITPTDAYYQSYFYRIDSLSSASNFSLKSIGQKYLSETADPYQEDLDLEIPFHWNKPDKNAQGHLIDPVRIAFETLHSLQNEIPDLTYQDYEISGALLRIALHSETQDTPTSYLSQMTYLLSLADKNPRLDSLLCPEDGWPLHWSGSPDAIPPYPCLIDGKLYIPDTGSDLPIFLPKSYRDGGVRCKDRGTLNFPAPSLASSQEQRIPVQVVGFYDPGILATGSKCALVPFEATRSISLSNQTFSPDGSPTNGLFVWIQDLREAPIAASQIRAAFDKAGIGKYWKVATYEEFEFAQDLMQQFQSDRILLLIIASIILIVACSNIISLLVLLVHDKKKEIAILQSMGASFKSIASIFALCGTVMGMLGCFFGSIAAIFTLHHLDLLVAFLSRIQGRSAFNPIFFGQSLPNELSYQALLFVLIATPLLSLAAGLVPALKASRIHPSSTLRSQ